MKEERIQFECVMWLQSEGYFFFSIPNEATEGKRVSHFVSMGMRPGAADMIVVLDGGRVVFVEYKKETGKQSVRQRAFQERVEKLGHWYIIVRSVEELKKALSGL